MPTRAGGCVAAGKSCLCGFTSWLHDGMVRPLCLLLPRRQWLVSKLLQRSSSAASPQRLLHVSNNLAETLSITQGRCLHGGANKSLSSKVSNADSFETLLSLYDQHREDMQNDILLGNLWNKLGRFGKEQSWHKRRESHRRNDHALKRLLT